MVNESSSGVTMSVPGNGDAYGAVAHSNNTLQLYQMFKIGTPSLSRNLLMCDGLASALGRYYRSH